MAIRKSSLGGDKQSLVETPIHCPEHQAGPVPECGHRDHICPAPEIRLHGSFEEAVIYANNVFLRPGEARSEFYKDASTQEYHCIVAIGNIQPGKGHLILSDTGDKRSFSEQYAYLYELIDVNSKYLDKSVKEIKASLAGFDASISDMRDDVDTFMTNMNARMTTFQNTMSHDMAVLKTRVDSSLNELKAYIDGKILFVDNRINSVITDTSNKLDSLETRVDGRIEDVIANTSIGLDSLDNKIDDVDYRLSSSIGNVSSAISGVRTDLNTRIN